MRRRRTRTAASPRPPSTRANSGAIGATSPVSESERPSSGTPGASGTAGASGVSGLLGVSGPYYPRGVMPEIGWFSSTREESTGRRGHCPKAVVSLTWPYACGRSRRPSASGEKRPARALQGPHVDENLPISGRSPQFFCHEGSRGVLARANARIEPNSAARAKARSTGLRTKVGPGGQSGSRVCAPGASRASDADSARAKSCTRVLCRYSPRLGRRSSE